jgi:hypothetical protein
MRTYCYFFVTYKKHCNFITVCLQQSLTIDFVRPLKNCIGMYAYELHETMKSMINCVGLQPIFFITRITITKRDIEWLHNSDITPSAP